MFSTGTVARGVKRSKMHMVVMSFVDAILFVFVFFLILFSKNILGEGFPDT